MAPEELIRQAIDDEWSDPLGPTLRAVDALLELTGEDWAFRGLEAARRLRGRRPDSALLLAVTEAALCDSGLEARGRLEQVKASLEDTVWAGEIGLEVAHHRSLGVLSIGSSTRRVLESAAELGGSQAELLTDVRAVARGLGYLPLPVQVAPPEEAEALLLPAVAVHGDRVWTTSHAADTAMRATVRGAQVVVVAHPLVHLSTESRGVFRPHRLVTDLRV